MKRRPILSLAVVPGLCASLAACSVTHVPAVPRPPTGAVSPLGSGGTVTVTGKALRAGPRRLKVADQEMELDEAQYAAVVAEGVAEELRRQGYHVSSNDGAKLEVTVIYVTLLPAVMRHTCYVEVAVATGGGYVRGHQSQGLSGNPKKACDAALADVVVATLHDPGVRSFLTRDRPSAP
jgi:uncharacterized lipoprotein YajG